MQLVVSVMLLCLVLYDSFIKFWLVNTGIYQAIMTFFFPYKEFYSKRSHSPWNFCLDLFPLIIIKVSVPPIRAPLAFLTKPRYNSGVDFSNVMNR